MNRLLLSLCLTTLALPLCAQSKKVDFGRSIWPILEKNCVECHRAPYEDSSGRTKKPKGRVRFDTKTEMIKSKRGKLVKAGKPDESLLYEVTTLADDHEDRMPPPDEGKKLSQKQLDSIRRWIEEGGDYGKWTGEPKGKSKTSPKSAGRKSTAKSGSRAGKASTLSDALQALGKGLRPLPAATLADFEQSAFRVQRMSADSPLLQVSCYGEADGVDDARLEELLPLAEHIAELNLSASQLTDAGAATIAKMERLLILDLRRTEIGDHGAAALAACKELRTINLYGTNVGDYGLTALAALKHLEELYVWQTKVTDGGVARLVAALPGLRVVANIKLPDPMEDTGGRRRRR